MTTPIAGLNDYQQLRLAEVLRKCAVQVRAGATGGTGFFIEPRQVMTCRHVVAAAIAPGTAAISVTGFLTGSDEPRSVPATILDVPSGDWPDIAILGLTEGTADSCVILDACEISGGTELMSGGFPAKAVLPYQGQLFTAGLLAEGKEPAEGEERAKHLRILGDLVIDGMSGSPLVSLRSGLVVGIVEMTKSSGAMAGGFSTMFTHVLDKLPRLQPLVDRPPAAARKWIQAVGATNLKEAGRDRRTGARWSQTSVLPRIDLTVEQDTAGGYGNWQIGVRNTRAADAGIRVPRSAADLGGDVIRAVDGWSRRQLITDAEEVQILGRVLDRALLPGEARTAVDDDLTVPPFLLRVCVDKAGGLSQLPWEYACGDDAVPLSVNENLAFARFVDAPGTPPPPQDRVRVLGVIEMPDFESAEFRDYEDESGRTIHPSAREFARILSETFAGNKRIEFEPAVNMPVPELQDKLADGWDVVHYLGFAWATGGRIVISVGCGKRTTFNPISIDDLRKDYLAPSQCSVFVAEFHRPPLGPDLGPPADPGAFTPLLRDELHAVIVTQHPADLVDFQKFNDSFYEQITKGEIVELAAQAGRYAVRNSIRPDPDVTAFGSFTLTTRRAGEVRLLKPPSVTGGAQQASPPEAAAGLAAIRHGLDTVVSGTG
jgi:Trypsin-like peptidase domain